MSVGPDRLSAGLAGRYRFERELGAGGMAVVYLARDLKHGRAVAIKVIRPDLAVVLGRDRFLREIAIAARLRHPNIMPLYESGDAEGLLYFVMPYEEGLSLRARLDRDGALPIADAVSVLRDVARALAYAHEHGVVHRDVKPDNVMLAGDAAVVTDFGIAKAVSAALTGEGGASTLTQVGTAIGTPAYMAPEQGMGDPATDHRADIYAFGCLAFEVFAGRPPFTGTTTFQILAAQMAAAPPALAGLRSDVPAGVARLVARCLEKDPAARPQTAAELVEALNAGPTLESPARVSRPRARRAGLLAAALVVLGTAGYVLARPRTGSPATVAVLPFLSVGGDSTQSVLAAGFSDDIVTALHRLPWVRVMSRGGAANYRGLRGIDLTETGRALGAGYLVTGSVRSTDGKFSVELIESANSAIVWTDQFDRPAELTALRDTIARIIGDSLRVRAGGRWPSSGEADAGSHRIGGQAYQLYIMGKEKLSRRGQSIAASIQLFRDAIAADSLSAEAYSGLSLALALTPYFMGARADSVGPIATAAARRALALNPALAEPHIALGIVHEHGFLWDSAAAEFRAALARDPHLVEARLQYGRYFVSRGRAAEALEQLRSARADDPASAVVASLMGYAWYVAGRMDSALAESARAQRIDSTNQTTLTAGGTILLVAGRAEEAHRLALRATLFQPPAFYLLAATGDRATAFERLDSLERIRPVPGLVNTSRAFALLGVGDTAQALTALERATDAREIWPFTGSVGGRMYDGVRESPRFQALLKRIALDSPR